MQMLSAIRSSPSRTSILRILSPCRRAERATYVSRVELNWQRDSILWRKHFSTWKTSFLLGGYAPISFSEFTAPSFPFEQPHYPQAVKEYINVKKSREVAGIDQVQDIVLPDGEELKTNAPSQCKETKCKEDVSNYLPEQLEKPDVGLADGGQLVTSASSDIETEESDGMVLTDTLEQKAIPDIGMLLLHPGIQSQHNATEKILGLSTLARSSTVNGEKSLRKRRRPNEFRGIQTVKSHDDLHVEQKFADSVAPNCDVDSMCRVNSKVSKPDYCEVGSGRSGDSSTEDAELNALLHTDEFVVLNKRADVSISMLKYRLHRFEPCDASCQPGKLLDWTPLNWVDYEATGAVAFASTTLRPPSYGVSTVYLAILAGHMTVDVIHCHASICKPSKGSHEYRLAGRRTEGRSCHSVFIPHAQSCYRDLPVTLTEIRHMHGPPHTPRLHAACLGFPIVGDKQYSDIKGYFNKDVISRAVDVSQQLLLHSWVLQINAKTNPCKVIDVVAPDPLSEMIGLRPRVPQNSIGQFSVVKNENCSSNVERSPAGVESESNLVIGSFRYSAGDKGLQANCDTCLPYLENPCLNSGIQEFDRNTYWDIAVGC